MAASGANISAKCQSMLAADLLEFLGLKPNGLGRGAAPTASGTSTTRQIALLQKTSDTAPANSTAADAPTGLGDIVLHYTAAGVLTHIYRCSAYTSGTVFTYTQIA